MSKQYEKDSLGTRMKGYEMESRLVFNERVPVIIRLDGKSFHTYTKGMKRPFDDKLANAMKETTKFLCENITDCRFGYTQSDEITLVLTNDRSEDYSAWYGNQLQKIVSVAASYCTFKFNSLMFDSVGVPALFDARAFELPTVTEACNAVYWRQLDAMRNSVQMLAQSLYSHKDTQFINNEDMKVKMVEEKGIDWSELEVWKQRGTACIKGENGWELDGSTPVFKDDWDYLIKLLEV